VNSMLERFFTTDVRVVRRARDEYGEPLDIVVYEGKADLQKSARVTYGASGALVLSRALCILPPYAAVRVGDRLTAGDETYNVVEVSPIVLPPMNGYPVVSHIEVYVA
jgi:hypothetical protein